MKISFAIVLVAAFAVVIGVRAGWFSSQSAAGLDGRQETSAESPVPAAKIPSFAGSVASDQSHPPEPAAVSDLSRTIPPAELPNLINAATGAAQRAALEDGIVTADEYRAAWAATHQCVVEAATGLPGVVINDVEGPVGGMSFGMSAPTKDLLDSVVAFQARCLDEHARSIASGWGASAAYERIARVTAAMAVCMRKEGAVVPDGADWLGLLAASQAAVGGRGLYDRCSAQVPPD